MEEEGRRGQSEVMRGLNLPSLAVKMMEGATSQGMWQPLEAGKGKEKDSPLSTPGCQPSETRVRLLAHSTARDSLCCFKPPSLW